MEVDKNSNYLEEYINKIFLFYILLIIIILMIKE